MVTYSAYIYEYIYMLICLYDNSPGHQEAASFTKDIFRWTAVASVRDSHTGDPNSIHIRLLHHGNNRGRHSANHNLLPDMHLRVAVLCVKTCLTLSLFKIREVIGKL